MLNRGFTVYKREQHYATYSEKRYKKTELIVRPFKRYVLSNAMWYTIAQLSMKDAAHAIWFSLYHANDHIEHTWQFLHLKIILFTKYTMRHPTPNHSYMPL